MHTKRPFRPAEATYSFVTHDPYYPLDKELPPYPEENTTPKLSRVLGVKGPPLLEDPKLQGILSKIDATRITNRIIAVGIPSKHSSDQQSHRNNLHDLAYFLNKRYQDKYLIWNLASDSSHGQYDTNTFKDQVVKFKLSKAYQLNLKTILEVCKSIHAWLHLDSRNVCVVHCINGIGRTGIAVACYLKFARLFTEAIHGLEYFYKRRRPGDWSKLNPSNERYVHYFNNIMLLAGYPPNPYPLKLHSLTLNGIPNFNGKGSCNPGIEIYEAGQLMYSCYPFKHSIYQDHQTIMFHMAHDFILSTDVQIRLFHQPNPYDHQVETMVNFSFNTAFMSSGLIRVDLKDLDFSRFERNKFPAVFGIDFVFSDFTTEEQAFLRPLSYVEFMDMSLTRSLMKIIQNHCVTVDESKLKTLMEYGYDKVAACFALIKNQNDLQSSLNYLVALNKTTDSNSVRKVTEPNKSMSVYSAKDKSMSVFSQSSTSSHVSASMRRLEDLLEQSNTVLSRNSRIDKSFDSRPSSRGSDTSYGQSKELQQSPVLSKHQLDQLMDELLQVCEEDAVSDEEDLPKQLPKTPGHWQDILKPTGINLIESSLNKEEALNNAHVKRFEELLRISSTNVQKPVKKFTNLLDIRRANNVLIGLSRFQRRGLSNEQLIKAICLFDESLLELDDLQVIHSLLPTKEEQQLLRTFQSRLKQKEYQDLPSLSPAEQFMLEFVKESDLDKMASAFQFKLQYKAECEELTLKLDQMGRVLNGLKSSDRFKLLLKMVLQLKSLSNDDYCVGEGGVVHSSYRPWMGKEARALGFKIEGLARLKDVKSADGKWSLMNFLVERIIKSNLEVLNVMDDFPDLRYIKDLDMRDLVQQLHRLEKTWKSLLNHPFKKEFLQFIKPLLEQSNMRLVVLQTAFDQLHRLWKETAVYLGEDLEEYLPFFSVHSKEESNKKVVTQLLYDLGTFFEAFQESAQIRKETS